MIRRPPRSTLFPYTTLFRSLGYVHKIYRGLTLAAPDDPIEKLWVAAVERLAVGGAQLLDRDRKSTRLNSTHQIISYAVFCLKKKTPLDNRPRRRAPYLERPS